MSAPTEVSDPHGLLTRQFQVDPYPTYARLREESPAYFSEGWGGWLLTRYQDVQSGFKDNTRLSSNRAGAFGAMLPAALKERLAPVVRSLSSWALLIDPPDHTRIRSLVNKAFTPRLVEFLRPKIQELVDGMLDKGQANGRMDIVLDLANLLPVSVIGDMLGIPREDSQKLTVWSNAFATFFGTAKYTPDVLEQMRNGIVEMEDYFRGLIAQRRKSATVGNDLLSTMIAAEEQGQFLSEQEVLAMCSLVLFAGHETTTHLHVPAAQEPRAARPHAGLRGAAHHRRGGDPPLREPHSAAQPRHHRGLRAARADAAQGPEGLPDDWRGQPR
jgi:hypothetical protein